MIHLKRSRGWKGVRFLEWRFAPAVKLSSGEPKWRGMPKSPEELRAERYQQLFAAREAAWNSPQARVWAQRNAALQRMFDE